MKVVIDTNILINGSADENSLTFRIIKEVIEGRLEAYANHQTMSENRHMLRNVVKDREYKQLLEDYFRRLNIVQATKKLNVVSDPEDNKLFESAAAVAADYLVSQDNEVLAVEEFGVTKVVSPKEFWGIYNGRKEADSGWGDWTRMLMGN